MSPCHHVTMSPCHHGQSVNAVHSKKNDGHLQDPPFLEVLKIVIQIATNKSIANTTIIDCLDRLRSLIQAIQTITDKEAAERVTIDFLNGLKRVIQSKYFPENQEKILQDLMDAISSGQLKSKLWLLQTLKETNQSSLGTVFLCAGWYGLLPLFLLEDKYFSIQRVFLFDKDPLSILVSEDLNRHQVKNNWKFKSTKKDILQLDYTTVSFTTLKANKEETPVTVSPDTIINTACEHIKDFSLWWEKIPAKKLIILQSNNYFDIPLHVNCHASLEEFKKQAPMKHIIHEGVLDLEHYQRFLLIGLK